MKDNKEVKANTKSATNPFTNTSARGNNASVHLKLTLGADASAYEVCPPQVRKICNILFSMLVMKMPTTYNIKPIKKTTM